MAPTTREAEPVTTDGDFTVPAHLDVGRLICVLISLHIMLIVISQIVRDLTSLKVILQTHVWSTYVELFSRLAMNALEGLGDGYGYDVNCGKPNINSHIALTCVS